MARHNARVYGVEHKVQWIHGDCLQVLPTLKNIDVVFLSPPWGGPKYKSNAVFDLRGMEPNYETTFFTSLSIAKNIIYLLPRNSDLTQLEMLAYQHQMLCGHITRSQQHVEQAKTTTSDNDTLNSDESRRPDEDATATSILPDQERVVMDIEQNYINQKAHSLTAYYGNFSSSSASEHPSNAWKVRTGKPATGAFTTMDTAEEDEPIVQYSQYAEENAKLKERMLRLWVAVLGQQATIHMHER